MQNPSARTRLACSCGLWDAFCAEHSRCHCFFDGVDGNAWSFVAGTDIHENVSKKFPSPVNFLYSLSCFFACKKRPAPKHLLYIQQCRLVTGGGLVPLCCFLVSLETWKTLRSRCCLNASHFWIKNGTFSWFSSWILGEFPRYAVYTTPQIPMVTPELFYQQARDFFFRTNGWRS